MDAGWDSLEHIPAEMSLQLLSSVLPGITRPLVQSVSPRPFREMNGREGNCPIPRGRPTGIELKDDSSEAQHASSVFTRIQSRPDTNQADSETE